MRRDEKGREREEKNGVRGRRETGRKTMGRDGKGIASSKNKRKKNQRKKVLLYIFFLPAFVYLP